MKTGAILSSTRDLQFRALAPFIALTFTLSWGLLALLPLLGGISGRHPLFVLAVWSPAISAFIVILASGGVDALKGFLRRLTFWRVHWSWYAFLLIGIPILFLLGAWAKGGELRIATDLNSVQGVLVALALTMAIGPIEEFGWRGLALPLLQRRMAPIWASLVLGVLWATWHLPAFLLSGTPQSEWPFGPFFIASVALTVIITPLFNASRGSILLPMLLHFQVNNPLWPDAQPYDSIFFVAAAVAIVFLNRNTMFSRTAGATPVLPSEALAGLDSR